MTTTSAPPPKAVRPLLDRAEVIWLTTVRADGQPQASPVWFVFDGAWFIIYSRPEAQRIGNIGGNPRVALTLNGGRGTRAVSVEAVADILDGPPATSHQEMISKYSAALTRMGATAAAFASEFSTPIRLTPTRWRVDDVS